jgi:hypothetical protein
MMKLGCILMAGWLAALPAPAQVVKKFPAHWGQPPAVQTDDLKDLPDGYGRGSSTLEKWISAHLARDKTTAEASVPPLYACDFGNAQVDQLPDGFLVLDGAFAVKSEGTNKFLELAATPVDSFGVLFGPVASNNVAVCARIYGTNKGRREPVFGVGLNGGGGLRLVVAPGKGLLELLKGDESVAKAAYRWESGQWTWLRLRLRQVGEGEWEAKGRAWPEGTLEPTTWQVTRREKSELAPGRASIWGSPISSTPIRFDDLKVLPSK